MYQAAGLNATAQAVHALREQMPSLRLAGILGVGNIKDSLGDQIRLCTGALNFYTDAGYVAYL